MQPSASAKLLLPITLVGYVIWLARIYMVNRASGASISAQGPLSARSFMHTLGLRGQQAAPGGRPSRQERGGFLALTGSQRWTSQRSSQTASDRPADISVASQLLEASFF